jgi:hypothetical protein
MKVTLPPNHDNILKIRPNICSQSIKEGNKEERSQEQSNGTKHTSRLRAAPLGVELLLPLNRRKDKNINHESW